MFDDEIDATGAAVRAAAQRAAAAPDASDGRVAMTFRVVVNPITCVGDGMCAELFPERITLDDWGYPIIDPAPIPARSKITPDARLRPARRWR